MEPHRVVKPSYADPVHLVDVFDSSRKNESGEMYCIAPAILPSQVEEYWNRYINPDAYSHDNKCLCDKCLNEAGNLILVSLAAAVLGARGGSSKSPAKVTASRENRKLGGINLQFVIDGKNIMIKPVDNGFLGWVKGETKRQFICRDNVTPDPQSAAEYFWGKRKQNIDAQTTDAFSYGRSSSFGIFDEKH